MICELKIDSVIFFLTCQGYEVLILLNELLPAVTKDHNDPFILHKQCFLASHPYLLQNLGMDVLPQLIQVG